MVACGKDFAFSLSPPMNRVLVGVQVQTIMLGAWTCGFSLSDRPASCPPYSRFLAPQL